MKIFVGNLATKTVEQDLLHAFQVFGDIGHVNIAKTTSNGQSRGFGYVDVPLENEGQAAIIGLNGASLHGQRLRVSEAHRKKDAR